ncbi:MAG: ATP-grasp domain-containing protein [Candidatus Latescibacterota bacterium]|nr:ATP-grasp domain-containing protein [Candidatus Latescibacterota bacterium]
MKVAVSGVGGGVGQSVLKALAIAVLPVEVAAVDVQPLSAGLYLGLEYAVLPRPETPDGLAAWSEWAEAAGVVALIPGSDHDLLALAAARDDWQARGGCRILVSDRELVETCRDKAKTCQRLVAAGLPAPRSIWDASVDEAAAWARDCCYPVVLKPRDGSASRGVHVVGDEEELRFFFARTDSPIIQEYLHLHGQAEEFTCAVFAKRDGGIAGTFMARRDLSGGATYRAEVGQWPEIDRLLRSMAEVLCPRGPLNVQLRLTERGPVPFECNIRCSGTSAIRAHFGFNEPEMLLRHYLLDEDLKEPPVRTGYVLRYWDEVFIDGADRARLRDPRVRNEGRTRQWWPPS